MNTVLMIAPTGVRIRVSEHKAEQLRRSGYRVFSSGPPVEIEPKPRRGRAKRTTGDGG